MRCLDFSRLYVFLVFIALTCVNLTVAQSNSTIVFELLEEQKADTFVGNVAQASGIQSEVSSDDFQNLRYQILSSDGLRISSMFTINSRSSILYTNAMIDREQICDSTAATCTLRFDVAVKLEAAVKKILQVLVVILDINDNAPSFPVKVIRQNLSESSSKESDISIPSAIDRDAQVNTGITYWIEENQVFALREEKLLGVSLLKMVLLQDLDRETQNEYQLHVYAKDGNTSSALTGTLSVVVTVTDANDNSPQFAQSIFNFTVSEDAGAGSWVGTVEATDLDAGENGRITFQFSSSTSSKIRHLFDLNTDTGNVTAKSDLEYESGQTFQAVIVAIDHGGSPKASQGILIINIIDVGNTPPKLSLIIVDPTNQNSTVISEDSPVARFVGTLRYQDNDKADNGVVDCTSLNPHFVLEALEESGYAIEIKSPLDREAENELTVVLKCSDRGTPSLSAFVNFSVRVSDVNDNIPVFEKAEYSATLKEGDLLQQNVLQVLATDADEGANREVTYLLSMNANNSFSIDPLTGWISLNAAVDRETEPIIRLTVEAVDRGQPPLTGSVTVTIFVEDVNDNIPVVTRTLYQVKENQEIGAFVAQVVATDVDDGNNARLKFQILSDPFSSFKVSEEGIIATAQVFDRETIDRYLIVVSVSDMGTPSLTSSSTLTIDITDTNDHSPQIVYPRPGNNSVTISANLSPGAPVTKIIATDSDIDKNAKLLYLIAEGNAQIFSLDNSTGTIFLARRFTSSRDTAYRLTVSVQDGGSPRLSQNTLLYINVDFTNVTMADVGSSMEQKYVIIAGAIAGTTVVIAVILIAIIIKLRRSEPDPSSESGRKLKNINLAHSRPKIFSETNVLEVSAFKVDSTDKEVESEDKAKALGQNTSFDSNLTNCSAPPPYRPSLTREMVERQGTGQFSLFLEGRQCLASEDVHSDSSADATTSDSGRGASDVDDVFIGEVTTLTPSVSRAPSSDTGMMLPSNERRNLTVIIPPNSNREIDFLGTPNDYATQRDLEKMHRTPSKVRFFIDDQRLGNRRLEASSTPHGVHISNRRQLQNHPWRHSPDPSGQRQGIPRYGGGQILYHRNSNQPTQMGFSNIQELGHDARSQLGLTKSVSLSMEALEEHNRLQNDSSRQQRPPSNIHSFLLPRNNLHRPHSGQVGVDNQSVDDEDNGSTTTSGSYVIEAIDDTISASVEC